MRQRVDIRENKSTRGARVDSKRVMASTLWIYLQLNVVCMYFYIYSKIHM